jgi:hypothetical protein
LFHFPFGGLSDEFIDVFFAVLEGFGVFLEELEVARSIDRFGDQFMDFQPRPFKA